jgi:N-acetylglucosaminyldiphosphoundecaprenol N-acetyl-beta-D-mannosaminyltransferase
MAMKRKKMDRSTYKSGLSNWDIFGTPMFGRDRFALLKLVGSLPENAQAWIATVNPEFVMKAQEDMDFMRILQNRTTYNVADGVGLLWAKEVLKVKSSQVLTRIGKRLVKGFLVGMEVIGGRKMDGLISGADLIDSLCKEAAENNKSVFFLGGWGDRGARSAALFKKKYPTLKVSGSYAGNRVGEDEKTLKVLSEYKIDYLFVAYAMKTQEEWINRNLDKLKIRLVMGVGRSFDYYSGDLRRAPTWVRKMGFEWLYSLIMEPKRWKRQLALPRFIGKVLVSDR